MCVQATFSPQFKKKSIPNQRKRFLTNLEKKESRKEIDWKRFEGDCQVQEKVKYK
jgi:hypothetical protein